MMRARRDADKMAKKILHILAHPMVMTVIYLTLQQRKLRSELMQEVQHSLT
jgi:hypothetical protein